jgi:hypothetical protein
MPAAQWAALLRRLERMTGREPGTLPAFFRAKVIILTLAGRVNRELPGKAI